MNPIDIFIGLLVGLGVAFAAFVFYKNRIEKDHLGDRLEKKIADLFPEALKNAQEQLLIMAREKLSTEKQEIKVDLENKRQQIEKMVQQVQKDLRETDRTSQSILQQMKDHAELTTELRVTTDGLRKVLTNNQLRGQFGEQVAEDLLKMSGFVKGVDFDFNKTQSENSTRPDFTIYLPDKTKINVDVKFPYASLQRATETEDKSAKKQLMTQFAADVREKIRQITTREYISPKEKTVDFVILFVPNEMIFSYIYDKMNEVWREAMERKVVLAGPFSFTAILRMIRQAHSNFRYQENIQEIVGLIQEFEKQFDQYNIEFNKLGSQLKMTADTFERVESTRTKQLTRVVEKIKLESKTEKVPLLENTS